MTNCFRTKLYYHKTQTQSHCVCQWSFTSLFTQTCRASLLQLGCVCRAGCTWICVLSRKGFSISSKTESKYEAEFPCVISTQLVSRRGLISYHGAKKETSPTCCRGRGVFMRWYFSPCSQGRAPTMNTIQFSPGSTSHRSYCCLQRLEGTSKATVGLCIPVRALQPLENPPPLTRSPTPLIPTAIFNDFFPQRHTQDLVARCIIVGESSEAREASL